MDVFYVDEKGKVSEEKIYGRQDCVDKLIDIGKTYLRSYDFLETTTDMDGVLIIDDNALDLCGLIGGEEAIKYFKEVSKLNVDAVARGELPYCWNSPAVFVGSLLKGLPVEINRVIGKHMRLVPGAHEHIEDLLEIGYEVLNLTAGHQEGAEAVSDRLGIINTDATEFGILDKKYNGEIKRFIGGIHKYNRMKDLISYNESWNGIHVGDSHSDIESMQGNPYSIAWNPAHDLATHSATINVFGKNKRGLTPLFDSSKERDSLIQLDVLPDKVVVFTGKYSEEGYLDLGFQASPNSDLSNSMRHWGNNMRKAYVEEMDRRMPYQKMMKMVRNEIREKTGYGVKEFQEHVENVRSEVFLPLEQFQERALSMYRSL